MNLYRFRKLKRLLWARRVLSDCNPFSTYLKRSYRKQRHDLGRVAFEAGFKAGIEYAKLKGWHGQ